MKPTSFADVSRHFSGESRNDIAERNTLFAMPEGDTIYRAAAALRIALIGKKMTRFEAPRLTTVLPRVGQTIEEVRSRGKHLEIVWDDGIVLHTHMRMTGSWHLYHPGEQWRKPSQRARVVIGTLDWEAVCFSAPVVETYRDFDPRRHPILGSLGPDLCQPSPDLDECVRRMMSYTPTETSIAEVLLDQRVMCGVGNVYRCELLWATEIHPWARVGDLSHDECRELVSLAHEMLRANLTRTARITAPRVDGGLAVYGRQGKKCPRCSELVRVTHHGEANRVLYWCSGCQTAHTPQVTAPRRLADDTPTDKHPAARVFAERLDDAS
jgi:endonuclease-8